MANIHPDIKPNGLNQRDLVNVLYMIVSSIQGIAAKLDADGTVTDTNYEASCVTALFNCVIDDCRGNHLNLAATESSTLPHTTIISPLGVSDESVLELMYQISNAMEVLTTKLDNDAGVPFTNYEATAYTACYLHVVENMRGNSTGNGTSYYFRRGTMNQDKLVDWLYNAVNSINQLCAGNGSTTGLDPDVLGDSNYNALWYTANITLKIENSSGNVIGN